MLLKALLNQLLTAQALLQNPLGVLMSQLTTMPLLLHQKAHPNQLLTAHQIQPPAALLKVLLSLHLTAQALLQNPLGVLMSQLTTTPLLLHQKAHLSQLLTAHLNQLPAAPLKVLPTVLLSLQLKAHQHQLQHLLKKTSTHH